MFFALIFLSSNKYIKLVQDYFLQNRGNHNVFYPTLFMLNMCTLFSQTREKKKNKSFVWNMLHLSPIS